MSASLVILLLLAAVGDPAPRAVDRAIDYSEPPLQVQVLEPDADETTFPRAREPRRAWHLVAFPMLLYRPDDGFGVGGVLSTGLRHDGAWPLEGRLRLRTSITTRYVQRHEARVELHSGAVVPVWLRASVGWFSTRSYNYCGIGNGVRCSATEAQEARAQVPVDALGEEIEDKYYRVRFMEPYVDTLLRARLWDGALDVDAFTRVRAVYHLPGDTYVTQPYPGTRYAKDFPDGERGLWTVPELGLALDTRDVAALPTRGMYAQASVRGSSAYWGSESNFGGAFASFAIWRPLFGTNHGTLGFRLLADALVGDVPTVELGRTGGTEALTGFGGPWLGRGIREARYIGKLKVIPQAELRTRVVRFLILRNEIDVGAAVFGDAAWIGADWDDLAGPDGELTRVLWTVGGGLRILINRDNVIRLDVALSPFEERGPQMYGYSGNTGVQP